MTHQLSEAQLKANRENAQLSTGPTSSEGKAKSSLNAVKTGLTGRTVLLCSDDAEAYRQHLERHFARFAPATEEEHTLVQFLADTEWRLLRITPLEASLWVNGRREFANEFADETDAANREALLLGKILREYRRDFSNLALQERRLRNQYKNDREQLHALQQARLGKAKAEAEARRSAMKRALSIMAHAERQELTFDPAELGFVFSLDEVNYYRAKSVIHLKLTGDLPDVDQVLAAYQNEQKKAQAA